MENLTNFKYFLNNLEKLLILNKFQNYLFLIKLEKIILNKCWQKPFSLE